MSEPEPESTRLLDTLRPTIGNLQGLLPSRLQLPSVELCEEKYRLAQFLVLTGGVALFGLLALMSGTLAVVLLTWETAAFMWVLLGFPVLYAGLALWGYRRLRRRLRHDPLPFASTVAEFRKDRACFSSES